MIETGKQRKMTSSIDTSDYSGRSARLGPLEERAAARRAFLTAECPGKPRPEAHITCVVGHDLRHELIDDEKRLLGKVGQRDVYEYSLLTRGSGCCALGSASRSASLRPRELWST